VVHCFYHPDYVFPLPDTHPFPMDKFWRAEAMIRAEAGATVTFAAPALAAWEDLRRVHEPAYLERIRAGALDPVAALKLGLPAGESLLTRSRLETGGTLAAMEAALNEGFACNLAGGTHHAFADRGEGYCVLNDVAVDIRALHARRPDLRIAVIDTDAHQGNGTHSLFDGNARVFTYSIHVARNYPSVKVPGCLDVGVPRYVSGEHYLEQLEATLGPAFDDFRPDFVFWIAGADPHVNDRFGQMRLTDADFAARDGHVLSLIRNHGLPAVVLYGGGYNRDREHTARLHADTVLRAAAAAGSAQWVAPSQPSPQGPPPSGTATRDTTSPRASSTG
jgi:acetoin utilization deacetylase AcuC-like enzyme